jgi:O-antigen/teichoic acid export membrane protein
MFYINFLLSILIYVILFFATPFIVGFFNLPSLTNVARVLFLSIIVFSFYFIQQTQLSKKLNFRANALVNMISVAISASVALILALNGYGIWVLVFQQLSFHVSKALIFPFFLRWKPSFTFSWNFVKESWKFSIGIFGQSLLNVIFVNIYTLLIGKFDTIRNVGYYTQANKYSETVNVASNSILSAGTFPIFAQVHDDQPRLLRIYRRLVSSVTMLTFPLAIFLIIAAKPLIITLITEKWIESVMLFQLLIVSNLFYPIYTINVNILNARGESKNTFKLEIFKKVLIVLSIAATFSFGIKVMLIGLIVANTLAFVVSSFLIKKSIVHYLRHQVLDIATTLLLSLLIGIIVYLINYTIYSEKVKLIMMVFSFLLLYLVAIRIIFKEKWMEAKAVVLKKISGIR